MIGRGGSARGAVLLYHRIREPAFDPWGMGVTPQHFREHLEVVARRFTFARIDELARHGRRRRRRLPIAVTFDDGYHDNLELAVPVLEAADASAMFFIAGGGEHGPFWWDALERLVFDVPEGETVPIGQTLLRVEGRVPSRTAGWRAWEPTSEPRLLAYQQAWHAMRALPPAARAVTVARLDAALGSAEAAQHRRLTDAEVAVLADKDVAEIGAHTLTHPRLAGLAERDQADEIDGSRARLSTICGRPIRAFSYPFGAYDAASLRVVARAGFDTACTTVRRPVTGRTGQYEVPRVTVSDMPGDALEKQLAAVLAR